MDPRFIAPAGWQNSLAAQGRDRRELADRDADEAYATAQREIPGLGLFGPIKSFGSSHLSGPLPDPMWDAFFEAQNQAGATRMADNSVGAKRGMYAPTQTQHVQQPGMESNQIGDAGQQGTQAIIDGILNATGGPGVDIRQTPKGVGRGQTKLKVQGQRGGGYAR